MNTVITSEKAALDHAVAEFFGAAFDSLGSWQYELGEAIASNRTPGHLTPARLDALVEPLAEITLDQAEIPVYGAGFIVAVHLLGTGQGHLSWWQGHQRSKLALASHSKDQIDYSRLEWYRVPLETGKRHISGPFVDYLCSDEYTLTVSLPLFIQNDGESEFVGVSALDILAEDVERFLAPHLAVFGQRTTLVNRVGRVVVSSDPRYVAGDMFDMTEAVDSSHLDGFPLTLVTTG